RHPSLGADRGRAYGAGRVAVPRRGASFDIVARRGRRPAGGLAELEDTGCGAVYLRRDDDIHRRSNAARPHPELRVVSSVERHHRRLIGGRYALGFPARARETAVALFSDDGGGRGLGLSTARRPSALAAGVFSAGLEKGLG